MNPGGPVTPGGAPNGFDRPDPERPSSILLVDDDSTTILVLSRILAELGRLRYATNGVEALRLARQEPPDLVLLDIEMPGMSGLEVCNALKADPETNEVPVIFITSHHSQDDELAGLAAGAVDFIAKPPFAPLVKARARTQLRLKRLTDMLRQSATEDTVTGTHNRRQLEESLPKLWLRALREKRPISLLMIDIDFFKEYNDTRGHPQGDEALRSVAQAISENQSSDRDLLARYGGDEFALLLPESSPADAELVAQRIVAALARLAIPHPASTIADVVTVSIGGSTFLPEHTHASSNHPSSLLGPDDLLLAADGALYDAKEAGRGRACFRLMSTPASAPGDATDGGLSEPCDG